MKETVFFDSFYFTEYRHGRNHHTDGRSGANHHFIGLLEEGSCRIVSDQITIEAGPGEPFYIPLHLSYQSYWFSENHVRLRSYGFDYFPESDRTEFCLQKLPPTYAGEIRRIPLCGHPGCAELAALYRVLSLLLPVMTYRDLTSAEQLREQALDCMRKAPDCRISEVARQCNVAESTLYAAFQQVGTTPNTARQAMLLREAKRLLTTTDLPVQEISQRLGFSSASYFRKVLRAHMGVTPSQLRCSGIKL